MCRRAGVASPSRLWVFGRRRNPTCLKEDECGHGWEFAQIDGEGGKTFRCRHPVRQWKVASGCIETKSIQEASPSMDLGTLS